MSRGKSGYLIVTVLACLVAGVGIERVRRAVMAPIPETEPLPEVPRPARMPQVRTVTVEDPALKSSAEALRIRVHDLEDALAERDAELARLKQEKQAGAGSPGRPPGRDDFRKRMEQLKKENPEQYAEMEKRREEFRQRLERQEQNRNDFFASINTQSMTDAQRENHEKLIAALAKIDALRAQREQAGAQPGSEADAALRQSMRDSMMELGALYEQERVYLLEQAASAAGYQGDDAANFVEYIQQAVQSTTMQGGPGGPGGVPGGPPPGMP